MLIIIAFRENRDQPPPVPPYLSLSRLPVFTVWVGDVLGQDCRTPLSVVKAGGELTTKHVVAKEKVFKRTADWVARATDSNRFHHACREHKKMKNINCEKIINKIHETSSIATYFNEIFKTLVTPNKNGQLQVGWARINNFRRSL